MTPHGLNTVLGHLRRLVAPPPAAGGDHDLLDRFLASRDEAAFATLVARYGPLVRGVARRVLGDAHAADDVFQATFLVLAKRAASIRRRSAVGSWLYGVAYRLALQCRTRQDRRDRHERRAAISPVAHESSDPCAAATWADLLAVLDEELHRLPHRLRAPLLLCYYEGCTQDDAARRLGWSVGTLRRRLDSGRDLLRARLTRRGATLGAGLFATVLSPQATTAAVSPLLARATVDAALTFAAGRAVAEPIAQLAEEGLRMLGTSKLKVTVALVVLAGGLAGGIGVLPGYVLDGPRQEPPVPPVVAAPDAPLPPDGPLPAGAVLRHGEATFRHGAEVINLLVAPDGKTLLTQGRRTVRFWDAASGRDLGSLELSDDGPDFWTGSLTPDGRTLLTTRHNGTAQVWDLANRRLVRSFRLAVPPFDVTSARCAHSPDGRLIAVVTADGSLRVCDVTQGREIDHLRSHSDGVKAVAFTADSKTLILACDNEQVRFWDPATGRDTGKRPQASPPDAANLCLSPDGHWLAAAGPRSNPQVSPPGPHIHLWDLTTANGPRELRNASFAYDLMAFTPDSRYLLAPSQPSWGRILLQWDLETGRNMRQYPEHAGPVRALAFLPDGKTLITADDALHFWDWKTGQTLREPPRCLATGRGYALTPDGRAVAESDDAGTVHLWDAATGRELRRFEPSRPSPATAVWVNAVAVSPDGRVLAAQGGARPENGVDTVNRRYVWLWEVATGKLLHRLDDLADDTTTDPFRGGGGRGRGAGPGGGGRRGGGGGLEGDDDGLEDEQGADMGGGMRGFPWPPRSEATFGTAVNTLAFSPDSRFLASGGLNRSVLVWDVASGRELPAPIIPSGGAWAIAYAADGRRLIVWNGRQVAHVDPSGGDGPRSHIQAQDGFVVFSSDGSRMAVLGPSSSSSARIHDTANGQILGQIRNLPRPVTRIAFALDGWMIATASADESPTISLWDVASGRELKRFTGLRGQAAWLAFAADGQRLFSASTDTTVLVWDVSTVR